MSPEHLDLVFFTTLSPRDPGTLDRMLAAWAAHPRTRPTHWGVAGPPTAPFQAGPLREALRALTRDWEVHLSRRAPPVWTGTLSTEAGLSRLRLTFDAPTADHAALYALADALAEALAVEHGFVQPRWRAAGAHVPRAAWGDRARLGIEEYRRLGPRGLHARTYFGARLVALAGLPLLDAAPRLPGGVARFDLGAAPWATPFEALLALALEAEAALASAVWRIEDPAAPGGWRPGPRWIPPA